MRRATRARDGSGVHATAAAYAQILVHRLLGRSLIFRSAVFVGGAIFVRSTILGLFLLDHLHRRDDAIVLVELHDAHAMDVAALRPDRGHRNAEDHALLADEEQLVFFEYDRHAGDFSVTLGLDVDHAVAAAVFRRIRGHRRLLAVAAFRDVENLPAGVVADDFDFRRFICIRFDFDFRLDVVFDDCAGGEHVHLDAVIVLPQRGGAYAGGAASHWTHVAFVEADHATAGGKHVHLDDVIVLSQ